MAELVKSVVIPGSVQHFRGVMERLAIRYPGTGIWARAGIWASAGGEHLAFKERRQTKTELVAWEPASEECLAGTSYVVTGSQAHYKDIDITPPTRASWMVHASGELESGGGGIEAYEMPGGQHTRIDFLDGYTPGWPAFQGIPIGPAFVEFCEIVLREAQAFQVEELPRLSPEHPLAEKTQGKPGRPGLQLEREEYLYRLCKAQQGEQSRGRNPKMLWKEIAKQIQWKYGTKEAGIKLLQDARKRLARASPEDLDEVAQRRK